MIDKEFYAKSLKKIGRKFNNPNIQWDKWYEQYLYYESMWLDYFDLFIKLNTQQNELNKCIQFVFWESCPGGMPFPHQNYAFDNKRFDNKIDGTFDSYIRSICDLFEIYWKITGKKLKIEDLIKNLCNKKILIIDLYPTHGISLDSSNRKKLCEKVFPDYSLKKLEEIGLKLNNYCKQSTIFVTSELHNSGIRDSLGDNIKESIKNALQLENHPTFSIIKPAHNRK
jgi:hypothetical protein